MIYIRRIYTVTGITCAMKEIDDNAGVFSGRIVSEWMQTGATMRWFNKRDDKVST